MTRDDALLLLRALADPARLGALGLLGERPHYVEELAVRLGLAASTVTFHLKKLEAAGLIAGRRQQYYTIYALQPQALEPSLQALVDAFAHSQGSSRAASHRHQVLRTFVQEGRVQRLPVQQKKRLVVLEEFAALLEPARDYQEPELNALFLRHYPDYCTVRRELVDLGIVERQLSVYRLARDWRHPLPSVLLEGSGAQAAAGESGRERLGVDAGLYCVTNRVEGRVFLGRCSGVTSRLASQRAQLEMGGHRCAELQADWLRLGAEAFTFEVLERLDGGSGEAGSVGQRLRELEASWRKRMLAGAAAGGAGPTYQPVEFYS